MKLDIRSKVVLTTAIIIVLVISVISSVSILNSRNIILSNTLEKELPAAMGEIANSINTDLQIPIAVSRVMATNPDYKQFLQEGEKDPGKITNYLKQIQHEFDATSSFYISDVTGNYYTADGILTHVTQSDPQFSWFYDFKNSGKPFVMVMNIDSANQKMTLFADYRVEVNGQFKALAGVGFVVDSVSDLIKNYKIGESGEVFLVDGNGVVTVHPDKSMIGKNYLDEVGVNKKNLLTQSKYQSFKNTENGYNSILATSYLADLGWYIVADVSEQEVFADLNNLTHTLIILGLVIAVFFLVVVTVVIKHLISPFSKMTSLLEDIGKGGGDLTIRLDDSRTDEVGRMAKGYNSFVESLADILKQVSLVGDDLLASVNYIDQKTNQMTSELSVQTDDTEQVATAVDEMGATAKDIANNAQAAAANSQEAENLATLGTQSVVKTLESVNQTTDQLAETTVLVTKLADETDSIDSVLEVIRSVSEQTNLLALNAAIEAARAGEHGRGFAVVADEVRTLASRSHDSAKEIQATIEKLKHQTQVVVESIGKSMDMSKISLKESSQSGEHLEEIVQNMSQVSEMNFQIASATEEQSNVVDEITPHVSAIARVSRLNSTSLNETSRDCQQLKEMATRLNQLVANFKLNK
jgi:methyl-accepting chemotaxis protein